MISNFDDGQFEANCLHVPVSMESEIVRVIFLSTMEISEKIRLKMRSSVSKNLNEYRPRALDCGGRAGVPIPQYLRALKGV